MDRQLFMKPHPNAKLRRNALLREYAATHPELSGSQIAQIFNITRQRVWQIILAGKKGNGT